MGSSSLLIPVYHIGKKEDNSSFYIDKSKQVSQEDGDWAGKGFYVWDNMGNAEYWLKLKERKAKNKKTGIEYTVLKLALTVNENDILDLTDPISVEKFEEYINKLQKYEMFGLKKSYKHKGELINAYYKAIVAFIEKHSEYSKTFEEKYLFKVTKVIGLYPMAKDSEFFKEKSSHWKESDPHVTIKAKPIYAVRDLSLLS